MLKIVHPEIVSEMGISEGLSSWLSFGRRGPGPVHCWGLQTPMLACSQPGILPRGKAQLSRIDTSRHGLRQKAAESLSQSPSLWKCYLDVILDVVLKLFDKYLMLF